MGGGGGGGGGGEEGKVHTIILLAVALVACPSVRPAARSAAWPLRAPDRGQHSELGQSVEARRQAACVRLRRVLDGKATSPSQRKGGLPGVRVYLEI